MTRGQRSPFGELVFASRTARNLTQAELARQLAAPGASGPISQRTIANIERRYGPDEPWSFNQQATIDILAEHFGFQPGSDAWNEFQAAANATRTMAAASRNKDDGATFIDAGRERQLARLEIALDQLNQGQHGLLFLAAEGGAGKTTLMLHACRQAVERYPNMVVLWGESKPQGHPYQPFVDFSTACFGLQEHASAEHLVSPRNQLRLQERLPGILSALNAESRVLIDQIVPIDNVEIDRLPAPLALSLGRQQSAGHMAIDEQDMLERAWEALVTYARAGPVVLVFDNLHLAEEESVTLLLDTIRRLQHSTLPVLILGSYRPFDLIPSADAPAPPFAHVLSEVVHQAYDPIVNLETSIGGQEGRAYIEALVTSRVQDAPDSLVDDLLALTDGLPLFVDAVMRWYHQHGTLLEGTPDDPLAWDDSSAPILPTEMGDVFRDLFTRLPERHQAMLQAASVQGTPFSADVLQRVLGLDRTVLIDELVEFLGRRANLVESAGARIIARQKSFDYRFFHARMRDFVYAHLDPDLRQRLHLATAQAMIDLWGVGTHNGARQIARQFDLGQDSVAAAGWYLRAGDFHLFRHEHRQAMPLFLRATELEVAEFDAFTAAQSLIGVGNCARNLGDLPTGERYMLEARELARTHGARLAEANALTSVGMVHFDRGEMVKSASELRQAIQILRELGNSVEVCRSLALYSHALLNQGLIDEARAAAAEAIEMATVQEHDALYVQGMVATTECHLALGNVEHAIALARRGFAIAEEHDDSPRMALCTINLALGLIELKLYDEALRAIDRISKYRQVITGRVLGAALHVRGMILLAQGLLDDAERSITESLDLRRRHHQHALALSNLTALLRLAIARRNTEAASDLANEIVSTLDNQGTDGLEQPAGLFLTLADAGDMLGDASLVRRAMRDGRALLHQRAALISNARERAHYLEGREHHRQLLAYIG